MNLKLTNYYFNIISIILNFETLCQVKKVFGVIFRWATMLAASSSRRSE